MSAPLRTEHCPLYASTQTVPTSARLDHIRARALVIARPAFSDGVGSCGRSQGPSWGLSSTPVFSLTANHDCDPYPVTDGKRKTLRRVKEKEEGKSLTGLVWRVRVPVAATVTPLMTDRKYILLR